MSCVALMALTLCVGSWSEGMSHAGPAAGGETGALAEVGHLAGGTSSRVEQELVIIGQPSETPPQIPTEASRQSPATKPTGRSVTRAATRPAYKSQRAEEDWTALRYPALRTGPLDSLKFIPLTSDGKTSLSLGADVRLTYEFYNNDKWGAGTQDPDGYFLQRYLVHGDLRSDVDNMQFRVFGQIISGLENAREGGPRSSDEDELDVHQAFAEWSVAGPVGEGGTGRLGLRLGRQQLQFGSGRILSYRNKRNIPNSFDSAQAYFVSGGLRIDALAFLPVETDAGKFDNDSIDGSSFTMVYATYAGKSGGVDLYYFGGREDDRTYVSGTADERRNTFGTRLFANAGSFEGDIEPRLQLGTFGEERIFAYAFSGSGYAHLGETWKPRAGVEFDVTSGDTDNGGTLGTYSKYFYRAGYISEISLVSLQNLININPRVDVSPTRQVTLTGECFVYWRYALDDGVYGSTANVARRPGLSRARFVGLQPTFYVTYKPQPNLSVIGEVAYFAAGSFIQQTGPSDDVTYFRLEFNWQF